MGTPVKKQSDTKQLVKSVSNVKIMSQRKQINKTGIGEIKVFRQRTINTGALDWDYDRVGSVSPLKYRPNIDMEGLVDKYERKRNMTPDPMMSASRKVSRSNSNRSLSRTGGSRINQRSNSKRSILKSTRSNQMFEHTSPRRLNRPTPQATSMLKGTVSFADLTASRENLIYMQGYRGAHQHGRDPGAMGNMFYGEDFNEELAMAKPNRGQRVQ